MSATNVPSLHCRSSRLLMTILFEVISFYITAATGGFLIQYWLFVLITVSIKLIAFVVKSEVVNTPPNNLAFILLLFKSKPVTEKDLPLMSYDELYTVKDLQKKRWS